MIRAAQVDPPRVPVALRLAGFLAAAIRSRLARGARQRAAARFARRYPSWHASLLDETLLATVPAEPCRRRAAHLAQAWTEQFSYRDEARRTRDVQRLEPMARTLLAYLAEEESRLRVTPR